MVVGGLQSKPPQVNAPGVLWLVGVGGVVLLGGLVMVIVVSAPNEAPGAREYHRRRLRNPV